MGGSYCKSAFQSFTPRDSVICHVLLRQAIFLLSPDTEFSSSGLGKKSNINYKTLFYNYKKVLVSKWTTRRVTLIVANINNYVFEAAKGPSVDPSAEQDHASAINRALAALDMDSSESDHESDASAQISAALSVANPPSIVSATQSPSAIDARPDFDHSQPEAPSDIVIRDAPVADVGAQVVEESTQNVGDSVSARGRTKTRGSRKKAAPQAAVSRTTRSRK